MKTKDLNKIAKIEKAIEKKYGKKAVCNPKSTWNQAKEEKFLQESKSFYKRLSDNKSGSFIKNLKKEDRKCQVCSKEWYFMRLKDEICFLNWSVCHDCFISHVQSREERWLSDWRPDKEGVFKNS